VPRSIENQQLLLDENGLSDDRTDAARTHELGERSDDMDEKDDEIAHLTILPRTAKPQELCSKPTIRHRQASKVLLIYYMSTLSGAWSL